MIAWLWAIRKPTSRKPAGTCRVPHLLNPWNFQGNMELIEGLQIIEGYFGVNGWCLPEKIMIHHNEPPKICTGRSLLIDQATPVLQQKVMSLRLIT